MEPHEILGIVQRGETSSVELKESIRNTDALKEALTAFANDWQSLGRGTIVVGVSKDGRPMGLPYQTDETLRRLADLASDGSIDPKPPVSIDYAVVGEKIIAVMEVLPGQRPPYRWNGRAYIRIGTQTRAATFEEEQELLQRSLVNLPEPLPGWLPPREEIAPDFVGQQ